MTLTIKQQREILVKWIDVLKAVKDEQFVGWTGLGKFHISHDYTKASVYGWLTSVPEAVEAGFYVKLITEPNGTTSQVTSVSPWNLFERWSSDIALSLGCDQLNRKQCIKALENFLHTSYK